MKLRRAKALVRSRSTSRRSWRFSLGSLDVAPLPASSGQTIRHRLSRGGDRQLNRALHTVVLHRRQHDAATRDYIARRVAEGKTTREATRVLKRYLARHLYRVMQNATPLTT
jgi:transposase